MNKHANTHDGVDRQSEGRQPRDDQADGRRPEDDRRPDQRPDKRPDNGRLPGDPRILEAWRLHLKRRTRSFTPFLVVPYAPVSPLVPGQTTDKGKVRPVPGGHPYWASPYIVVENSGGVGYTARAGENNFVHARVFNFGKATSAPTQVDFFWADPSLGLGPASFNHIGTEWVEIRHGASRNVRCNTPWVPTFLNGGHECLMVNTSNPTIAAGPGPSPGPFDPIQAPFAPVLDRHVGQRNLTVLPASAGEAMTITLNLNNVLPFAANMAVTARTACFEVDPELLEKLGEVDVLAVLVGLVGNPKAPREGAIRLLGSQAGVEANVGDTVDRLDTSEDRRFAALLVEHLLEAPGDGQEGAVVAEAGLKAGERRQLDVKVGVPGELKRGQFVVADLAQSWEGRLIGGYVLIGGVE